MTHLRNWVLAASFIATMLSAAVSAQPETETVIHYISVSGVYVPSWKQSYSGSAGDSVVFERRTAIRRNAGFGTDFEADFESKGGLGVLIALGIGADTDLGRRREIELGYRKSDMDKLTNAKATDSDSGVEASLDDFSVSGDVETLSLMANEFAVFEAGRFRPYLGIGAGLAIHESTAEARNLELGVEFTREILQIGVVWQGMAGIGLPIGESMEARLGLRCFWFDKWTGYGTCDLESGLLVHF